MIPGLAGESIGVRFHPRAAAAYVTSRLGLAPLPPDDEEARAARVEHGIAAGLDLHRFKRGRGLARVERVLGTLRGLGPGSLLELGTGRGAFLFPLLEALPTIPLAAVELEPRRLELLEELRRGGLGQLRPLRADATALPFAAASFDGVTALEILEHVPEAWRAAREAVRVARRFVIASVPSRPDDNPGHLRLYTVAELEMLFLEAGARRVQLEHVPGHRILIAHTGGGE